MVVGAPVLALLVAGRVAVGLRVSVIIVMLEEMMMMMMTTTTTSLRHVEAVVPDVGTA